MALDYDVHTYIATGGTEPKRKSHYIHSVKFYDNEEEMEAEREEKQEAPDIPVPVPEARDLLHMGNLDGYILKDAEQGRHTYNDQMLRYNSKFSQLVGKLFSNQD